jgi:hypothetical protein
LPDDDNPLLDRIAELAKKLDVLDRLRRYKPEEKKSQAVNPATGNIEPEPDSRNAGRTTSVQRRVQTPSRRGLPFWRGSSTTR